MDGVRAGLYVLPAAGVGAVVRELTDAGLEPRVVDGACSKHDLLIGVARALEFPAYARANWDSTEECLRDLSWLARARRAVVIAGASALAEADPRAWATALSVFDAAVRTHAAGDAPLSVFLLG